MNCSSRDCGSTNNNGTALNVNELEKKTIIAGLVKALRRSIISTKIMSFQGKVYSPPQIFVREELVNSVKCFTSFTIIRKLLIRPHLHYNKCSLFVLLTL